jgi:hypothetical protein
MHLPECESITLMMEHVLLKHGADPYYVVRKPKQQPSHMERWWSSVESSFITMYDQSNRHSTVNFPVCFLGHVPGTDFGPVISVQAKKRICDLVQSGIDEGARCVLDGRSLQVPGFEKGNFIGPTILTEVTVSCC